MWTRAVRTVRTLCSSVREPPLVDLHGRRHNYLRISLTERCNLRCQYCMPPEGAPLSPSSELLSREETVRLARVFVSLGVDRLRLTGGEPTVRRDLALLVRELRGPGVTSVGLTTNGLALTRLLPELQRAGLDRLNVSLDSLRADRYERLARRPGLPRVLAGLDLALQLGFSPLKLNVVLIKGVNDDEILDFVEMTRERALDVRFIEFMPFSGNSWDGSKMVPYREALGAVRARHELRACDGEPADTARMWRVPGWAGRVGFVASMTRPFCGGCNRLRLTATGSLQLCLFGSSGVSLRDAARAGASDDELRALIRTALPEKKAAHAGNRGLLRSRAAGRRALAPLSPPAPLSAGVRSARRGLCTDEQRVLSHTDEEGRARMVDVGDKPVTERRARASCRVELATETVQLLRAGTLRKGAALAVAELAGVMAAKRTAELLPLCHTLPLQHASVRVRVCDTHAVVTCRVRTAARTGAEMEALTGAAVAALALYDMCKSADKNIVIGELRLLEKTGGRSDQHARRATDAAT